MTSTKKFWSRLYLVMINFFKRWTVTEPGHWRNRRLGFSFSKSMSSSALLKIWNYEIPWQTQILKYPQKIFTEIIYDSNMTAGIWSVCFYVTEINYLIFVKITFLYWIKNKKELWGECSRLTNISIRWRNLFLDCKKETDTMWSHYSPDWSYKVPVEPPCTSL